MYNKIMIVNVTPYMFYWIYFYNPNLFLCSYYVWLYNCAYDKTYHLKQIYLVSK